MNATIKLYTKTVAVHIPFLNQEISVRFILTNESIDKVTEISGNPGYIQGRPIISSSVENNRSLNFFNITLKTNKYLFIPSNDNGICTFSNNDPNFVIFGINKRINCRYVYNKAAHVENSTDLCNEIERNIKQILGINEKRYISPYGNPLDVTDDAWVPIQLNLLDKITYGQFLAKKSKLRCYNMVTRISYIFTFADVNEMSSKRENKIMSSNISVTTENITFYTEEVSAVLTIDINFIDGTKPRMFEFAASPYINVHFPKDFFFPFRSSASCVNKCQSANLILILCYVMYKQIK